jgi:hypothetical protein
MIQYLNHLTDGATAAIWGSVIGLLNTAGILWLIMNAVNVNRNNKP